MVLNKNKDLEELLFDFEEGKAILARPEDDPLFPKGNIGRVIYFEDLLLYSEYETNAFKMDDDIGEIPVYTPRYGPRYSIGIKWKNDLVTPYSEEGLESCKIRLFLETPKNSPDQTLFFSSQ